MYARRRSATANTGLRGARRRDARAPGDYLLPTLRGVMNCAPATSSSQNCRTVSVKDGTRSSSSAAGIILVMVSPPDIDVQRRSSLEMLGFKRGKVLSPVFIFSAADVEKVSRVESECDVCI